MENETKSWGKDKTTKVNVAFGMISKACADILDNDPDQEENVRNVMTGAFRLVREMDGMENPFAVDVYVTNWFDRYYTNNSEN